MAVPEDVRRYLLPRKLLSARDLLNPGLFRQPVYGPKERLGAQVAGAAAREEPLLAGLDALSNGLQRGLAHSGGSEVSGLRPAALYSDEPVMKIDIWGAGCDLFPHLAAQVVEAEKD